jgi:hypothetical protein
MTLPAPVGGDAIGATLDVHVRNRRRVLEPERDEDLPVLVSRLAACGRSPTAEHPPAQSARRTVYMTPPDDEIDKYVEEAHVFTWRKSSAHEAISKGVYACGACGNPYCASVPEWSRP